VATPFGPVADTIEHGVNGLLADTRDEWADALERLRDPEERKRIGKAGRETVVREFSLKSAAPLYAGLLKGLVE
jgi:glycosyltransferase involved in cell wall biosynthesis